MHYKLLKLINGEDIIVTTDDNCDTFLNKEFIYVVDPIQITSIRLPRGTMIVESHILQPWLKMVKSDVIKIPTKSIVLAMDLTDSAIVQYKQYVMDVGTETVTKQETLDFDFDEEEDSLDALLQSVLEDSEEEDGTTRTTRDGKTIH